MQESLLTVQNLRTYFYTYAGLIKAVDDVSFSLRHGEILGVVGESGCGKTVMARSILRLIPDPPGRIAGGEILFKDQPLLLLSEDQMQKIRGNQISMIFQEPMSSLNPVYTIGNQLSEVFSLHQKVKRKEARAHSVEMLKMVGIPDPSFRMNDYPFQMSGGMRQRAMIAMALACKPKIILADEPTTALDVTIQAQILDLIQKFHQEMATAVILITHDLGVIAEMANRILVMYAGKIIEEGSLTDVFDHPFHPYTEGLITSIPSLDLGQNKDTGALREIPGVVPDLCSLPAGCTFFPRCQRRMDVCQEESPALKTVEGGHSVRCWLFD